MYDFCLTKKFMTIWLHLFSLVWIECWISNFKKIDMQQTLLYNTRNYSQYLMITYNGKSFQK